MQLTVDTSVLISVMVNEPVKGDLIKATRQAELIAPGSVHWEVGNALSAMIRKNRISGTMAAQALESYQKIPIRFVAVPMERSLQLVEQFGLYAYDAYLIAAAQIYSTALITLDKGLQRAAQEVGVEILEVL